MANEKILRRHFIGTTISAAAIAGIAGCLEGSDDGSGGNGEWTETLELLHGWTDGDGKEAAEALLSAFEEEYPDIDLDNQPVGGGGNESLDDTVSNRLNSNDPPSVFAGWPGANLDQYEGALGDIEEEVWEEDDLKDAHVEEAVELCQFDDGYSAVPIGSHRMNDLFYNVEVVEDAGVEPESLDDIDALIDALDAVDTETDAAPLSMTLLEPWCILQTWAVTMLSTQGYDAYMDFVEGNGDEDAVRSTFETLEEILDSYINADATSIKFTDANEKIMTGDAAFIHQGNWAAGAFINEGLEYGEDWDAIQFPGTEDLYGFHIDSFIYPADNPSADESAAFLRFAGSEDAQVAFNSYKGSIPTRKDTPTDEFNQYLVDTIEDFHDAAEKPPTLAHGLAVPADVLSDLKDAVANHFADPYDVDDATSRFMDIV